MNDGAVAHASAGWRPRGPSGPPGGRHPPDRTARAPPWGSRRAASGHAQCGGGRGPRSRKLEAGRAALTRGGREDWRTAGGGGGAGGGAAVAVRAPGSAGAAAGWVRSPGQRRAGAGSRAPPRVGGSARASAASWAPFPGRSGHRPREPPGLLTAEPERPPLLRRPLPPPCFSCCRRRCYRLCSPLWQRSRHPRSGSRRPAPQKYGPRRPAMPPPKAPLSRRAAGCVSSTAACPSRIRWPGTCMGRTKWVSRLARGSAPLPPPRAPWPARAARLCTPRPGLFRAPRSLATRAERVWKWGDS